MPSPTITITFKLQDLGGSAAPGGGIVVTLVGYGQVIPKIGGTSILADVQINPAVAADGSGSFTPWGNDVIAPGPNLTFYMVQVKNSQGGTIQANLYQFTGSGTFDLSSLSPININGPVIPVPPNAVLTNPTGPQSIATYPLVTALSNCVVINSLGFAGATSGSTSLQASAIASGNLTLPSGNDTLVARTTADILSNKTLVSPLMTGTALVQNLEQTLYADQFAGADMGAKINAAIAAAPSTGCVINARAFLGAQSAAATITLNKPIRLLLGGVTLTLAGSPGIILGNNASVTGIGQSGTVLVTSSATADIINTAAGAQFWRVSNLGLISSVTRTAGAAVRVQGSLGKLENLSIDKTFNGIQVSDVTGLVSCKNIRMGFLATAAGNWNTGIQVGPVASGTVSGSIFDDVAISSSTPFATGMILLDSGTDTVMFNNCQAVIQASDAASLIMRNTSTAQNPSICKFVNCHFESGSTKTAIGISSSVEAQFTNCSIATSGFGVDISGGTSTLLQGLKIIGCQHSGIRMTGGIDTRIISGRVSDTSLAANGGDAAIAISANVTDFTIAGVDFTTYLGSTNKPSFCVQVAAGTSDRYWIQGNTFANFVTGGISDTGTGLNKLVGFNSPFAAGSSPLTGIVLTQPSSLNNATLLNSQDAAAALTGNSADQTFYTFTIPGATLATGKGIRVSVYFIHGTGTASITYKLFFGATAVINTSSAVTGSGCMKAEIMNLPASVTAQRGSGSFNMTGTAPVITAGNAPAENTVNPVIVKATFNVANTDQVTPAQFVLELIQ